MKQSLKSRVEKALIHNPDFRDNDNTLCAYIWSEECKSLGHDFNTMSAVMFLHLVDTGKLSKQQTILRTRRKLNNTKQETVGKSYRGKKPEWKKKEQRIPEHHKIVFSTPESENELKTAIRSVLDKKPRNFIEFLNYANRLKPPLNQPYTPRAC